MKDITKARLIRLGLVLALIGGWLYVNGPGGVSPLMIPPLDKTLATFGQLLITPSTWSDAAITGFEILCAVLLSVVVGFTIGFLASRTPFRVRVVEPMVAWGYMVPFVLFYPLLLLWLGVDMESKIAFGFLNGVFAMSLNTIKGFKSVNANLIRAARAQFASKNPVSAGFNDNGDA